MATLERRGPSRLRWGMASRRSPSSRPWRLIIYSWLLPRRSPFLSAWPSLSLPALCSWWFTKPSLMTTAVLRDLSISTSAVSRPRWTLTTQPRTPAPGAASTQSSATTVWPSRALPGPSDRGCRQPPSSTSPSRPRPRAIRGPPQPGWGWWVERGTPDWLGKAEATRQHCTAGVRGGGGAGWGLGRTP
ncbi:hypothetical protein LEMLEM_LOCUS26168 [Lemmus lemmus]